MGGSDNECSSELLGVTSNKQGLHCPAFALQADTAPSGNGTIEPGNEPDNLIHFLFQSTRKPGEANVCYVAQHRSNVTMYTCTMYMNMCYDQSACLRSGYTHNL